MTSPLISLNIMDTYRKNANSKSPVLESEFPDATFDLYPRKGAGSETPAESCSQQPQEQHQRSPASLNGSIATSGPLLVVDETPFNPEVSVKTDPSRRWDSDVATLVSTKKWLQMYGLKRSRLDLETLIRQIAFRHSDDFDRALKMPVCSRYGTNLFQKYFRPDGQSFNITVTPEAMKQLETRLVQAISLFKRRLNWLTSESRRIFGVIEEKSICIVLDFKDLTEQQLHLYLSAVERALLEQVSLLGRFNLVRSAHDPVLFRPDLVNVTSETINQAVEWLWNLDTKASVPKSASVEALIKAMALPYVESVYLFSEGSATDGCREMLRERVTDSKIPVHVVSYNCTSSETIDFLKSLAKDSNARFHAYAVVMEMDTFEKVESNDPAVQPNLVLKKKAYGGVPRGAGMREDVILLFEELEEAKNNLTQIQAVMKDNLEKVKPGEELSKMKNSSEDVGDETYMSSAQWLRLHGIQAKRLGFYEVLSGVAFRHQDGVIDLKVPPSDRCQISEASTVKKLINAKYCDKFAHVLWKDGQMMHVHVTAEFFRVYKDRLGIALDAMQRRVDWLHRGSREIFGTVVENRIYLLIDTSVSMQAHFQFVKDKIFLLMQEQLRHKQMINMIAFNSHVYLWQKSLVAVSEQTLQHGWNWVRALTCNSTTNTMGALQHALADRETQAVYLLTDGRPDQPPKSIIAQTKLPRAVPIHTISFNCNDREANEFLYELAKDTGGRFHYYSQDGCEIDLDGPEPWQSEDIALLRKEIDIGWNTLEKIEQLKHDCELLKMSKDDNTSNKGTRKSLPGEHCCSDSSKFGQSYKSSKDPRPVSVSFKERSTSSRLLPSRPKSAITRPARISNDSPPIAAHTRTSLLRTMSSGGHFASTEWLLPETREMLERQEKRKKNVLEAEEKKSKQREKKNKKLTNSRILSSKKWLAKNGLIAKKLTIVDALAPTFISHEPKYVPILNKQVLSKVFDKVLPIAYLSEAKRRLHLVNPLAVDFNSYANKVKEATELYKKRLDRIVWNALTEEQKQGFDSDFPISFLDNEVALIKALTESGWPVHETDVQLLMKEIRQGDSYIEQAMALKEAALKCGEGLPEYKEKHLKESESDSEKAEKSKKKTKSEIKSTKSDIKVSKKPVVERNLKVVARNAKDGFYYPGVVKENVDIRRSEIQFVGKCSTEVVPTRFIIPLVGAVTRPTLAVGDYVLCRVLHDDIGQECYVPGRVMAKPIQAEDHGKFYAVSLYTGQQAQFLRIYLIKISHSRYQFTERYVKEVAKEQKKKKAAHDNDQSSDEESQRDESRDSSSDDDDDDVDKDADEVVDKAEEASDADEEDEAQKSGGRSSSRKTKDLHEILRRYIRRQIKTKKKLQSSIQKYCAAKRKGQTKDQLKKQLEEIDRLKDVLLTDRKEVSRKVKKKSVGDFSPVLEMRRSLSNLKVGEEVLARWSDDGWYYTGTVKARCGDDCYIIQDSLGDLEKIWREDIIANDDSSDQTIRKGDYVVALHPDFTFSYCPGKVRGVTRDFVTVVFYDKRESEVAKDEVYLIPAEKYDYDVGNIVACEERWVGQVVVARNDDTGLFYLGRVTERFGDGRQYMIKWTDGSKGVQSATYMFGPFSKRQKLTNGDFVLADDDNADQIVYKPGIVKKGSVDFFDSSRSTSLDPEVSFLLTEDFYHNLVTFLKTRERDSTDADSKASSTESTSEEEED